jgi:hypothetical protein
LKNNTEDDYHLEKNAPITLLPKLAGAGMLGGDVPPGVLLIGEPVFAPAGQAVRVTIFTPTYGFEEDEPGG